jgi:hypothetical protein
MTFHLSRLERPHDAPAVGCVGVDVTDLAGVSPLRWAGLLRWSDYGDQGRVDELSLNTYALDQFRLSMAGPAANA